MKTVGQLTQDTRVRAGQNAVGCEIEGEMVLLDVESGTYFGLNGVGADIWRFIGEERSVEEIERHLMSSYDVEPEVCRTAVRNLLETCAAKGLIHCH
jgi:hypothetical protein